jgi:protoporphyrinogen oxidase
MFLVKKALLVGSKGMSDVQYADMIYVIITLAADNVEDHYKNMGLVVLTARKHARTPTKAEIWKPTTLPPRVKMKIQTKSKT